MNRRSLIKSLYGTAALSFFPIAGRGWAAMPATEQNVPAPRLIVVMLRGAVDGLNVVVPYAEDNYYRMRSSIAIAKPGAPEGVIDLDGHFGLHPALSPLLPLWQSRRLAFVHASGSPDPSRSHFDAQDYMESGTPGIRHTDDGWMNRLLTQISPSNSSLDAVSLGPVLPRIFSGTNNVANIPLGRQASRATAMDRPEINQAFDRMYAGNGTLETAYREGRSSREHVLSDLNSDAVSPESAAADNGAPPPQGFSLDASQLATLIKRNPGLQLSFMQLGGWDTHVNQGGGSGQLANRLKPLAEGLVALTTQLGPELDNTVIVVMSEFGRTAHQNGTNGTDHGHGNVMWVLGGGLAGGKVYGEWPGIDDTSLHEQRDLSITTDFRTVLVQVCERHLRLGDRQLAGVFPHSPNTGAAALKGMLTA